MKDSGLLKDLDIELETLFSVKSFIGVKTGK